MIVEKNSTQTLLFRLESKHELMENSYLVLKAKVKKYYKIFLPFLRRASSQRREKTKIFFN